MDPVDHLVEQLWAPAVASGDVRVEVDPAPDPAWRTAESYWLVPDARRARLLLPRASGRVTAAAAANYRGLRSAPAQAVRLAAATAARTRLPLSPHTLRVQVRSGSSAAADLPLARLATALEVPGLHASLGVRTGANRKPTLSLVDGSGHPVGYAKLGWSDHTDGFVRTEAATLRAVAGRDGVARAPALLAEISYAGHPVIVTEPLPLDARGAGRVAPPTSRELHALLPVVRRGPLGSTAHLQAVRARLAGLVDDPLTGATAAPAARLADLLDGRPGSVPVTDRWHGDLVSWNCARDGSGTLWVWDWETAEPDAVAGLDALHWAFSERRLRARSLGEVRLADCLDDAAPHLVAAALPRESWPDVAATYALTVVERAATLARQSASWDPVWISPEVLAGLTAQAEALTAPRV